MTNLRRAVSCILLMLSLMACSRTQTAPAPQPQKQADQPPTKLEAFLGKRGRLLIKDSYDLGRISSMGSAELDALVIYEPGSSQKTKGLRVEVTEGGRLERSETSFLDLDELQSLSDALTYMSDLAAKWHGTTHDPYTEVTYVSKGEFSVGFFQRGTDSNAFISSGMVGPVRAYLKVPDLVRLKQMVDQAKTTLSSK